MEIVFFILLAIVVLVAAVFIIASRKPDTFRCERRMVMKASPEAIYPHIADLKLWHDWSPWAKKDPAMQSQFSASTSGLGAWQSWQGNNQVGSGKMTITTDAPPREVIYRLEFLTPFKATNTATFTLVPMGEDTEVIWSMHGPAPLMSKVMDLLMNMDKMIGRDFEAGLASLRAIVERR